MDAGLMIWNAQGQVILDGTKRVGRLLAMPFITGPNSGEYQDDRFAQGTPFCAFQSDLLFHTIWGGGGARRPGINYDPSARKFSWAYPGGSGSTDSIASGFLLMGVL